MLNPFKFLDLGLYGSREVLNRHIPVTLTWNLAFIIIREAMIQLAIVAAEMPNSHLHPFPLSQISVMNVLVYSGPGISQNSLSYTISTLKQLLQPNYVVQSVSPKILVTEPWSPSCALLVFPGGRDLPYLSYLTGPAMATIAKYVRSGGSYLGFCAGAYFASGRVEWEIGTPIEVQGDRPLKFFPGPSHGCAYPGFQYESERGARSVSIALPEGTHQHGLYYNGGGHFVMPESIPGITALAYYDDNDKPGMVAGVACEVEKGKAALWHVHLEFPSNCNLALEAAARSSKVLSSEALLKSESDRQSLLRDTLEFLGLDIGGKDNSDVPQPPSKPLPQLLCGTQPQVDAIARALHQLRDEKLSLIEDANDTFQLHEATTNSALSQISQDEKTVDIRHIVVFNDAIPSGLLTPHFSIEAYFGNLANAQRKYPTSPSPPLQSPIGSVLLYGEAVTSTQTLLQR
jgi:biotin---protein ligase